MSIFCEQSGLAAAAFFVVRPSGAVHTTMLPSGQVVTFREVQPTTFNQIPPSVVVRVPAEAIGVYRQHPVWGRFNVTAVER